MQMEVFEDEAAVARRAAAVIAENARQAVSQRGKFVMAVSGGKTPWSTWVLIRSPMEMVILPTSFLSPAPLWLVKSLAELLSAGVEWAHRCVRIGSTTLGPLWSTHFPRNRALKTTT
jgi:hypothetical protein